MKTPIILPIVEQHAEEAAFLWLLRNAATYQPHYDLDDLVELDERLEAHLDGLRIANDAGWKIAQEALSWEEPGEVFTAAMLAFETLETGRFQLVLEVSMKKPELIRAFISALGWLSLDKTTYFIHRLLDDANAEQQSLGIAALAVHRVDPGYRLEHAIMDENIHLRTRSLRATGELGRQDLLQKVLSQCQAKDGATRFWAAWSATLLGHRQEALETLKPLSLPSSPVSYQALQVLLRSLDFKEASHWLKIIAQHPQSLRHLMIGMGILGNPDDIPFLIRQMEVPQLARIAGEAFTLITGLNLENEDLEGDEPEGFEVGPTDHPEDETVDLDPDENLPWPHPILIQAWWQEHQKEYRSKERYLLGKPITIQHCQQILATGLQRQRFAAALELTLRQPGTPLFEIRAPGIRQRQLIRQSPSLT